MSGKEEILSIDIENIIKIKSGKHTLPIPRFVFNYIKRVIHQDEINDILRNNHHLQGIEFAEGALKEMNIKYNVHCNYPIDKSKRYIFVSNHPLGGLDGLVLIAYIGSTFGSVKFVVNDLLMNIKPLSPIFIPINKYGKMSHNYASMINDTFASDEQILYFPAGICSRMINGIIQDTEWKKTFLTKAIESNRDIVPIYFSGSNTKFFYRLAKIRKFFGIKFNIETFYLPDEMFKQKNSIFDLYIGENIPISTIDNSKSIKEWTNFIRNKCYEISKKINNQ